MRDINGRVYQYKCKPPSIEDIHWAASGISKNSIMTTVINAYEMTDDVTYEVVKDLLREEFDERTIDGKKDIIIRVMGEVIGRIVFRDKVLGLYKEMNLDLTANKAGTMRALSPHFPRSDMSKVYSTIKMETNNERNEY